MKEYASNVLHDWQMQYRLLNTSKKQPWSVPLMADQIGRPEHQLGLYYWKGAIRRERRWISLQSLMATFHLS